MATIAALSFVARRQAGMPSLLSQQTKQMMNTKNGLFTASRANRIGLPAYTILAPLPPPEFEADGSPRRYPLNQVMQNHGFTWESWRMEPVGCWHSMYIGAVAQDYSPKQAWLNTFPVWVIAPAGLVIALTLANLILYMRFMGIKPKYYTPEWSMAMRERERIENTNPCYRYLDRRVAERGPHWYTGNWSADGTWLWVFSMWNAHDHEYREERGLPDLRDV